MDIKSPQKVLHIFSGALENFSSFGFVKGRLVCWASQFLKDADLITGEVIAMDGTKIRANNSKKNNYSQKKIDRHLAYIEEK